MLVMKNPASSFCTKVLQKSKTCAVTPLDVTFKRISSTRLSGTMPEVPFFGTDPP